MQLHFEQSGQGHPLLILHGLFGSLENWRTLSKIFSRSFHVFALDQRNHGRSPHSVEFTYQAMADDLHEFMEEQELSSAYMLGHSMGGKTAMLFALTFPDLVDKLVVVDIAPKAYPRDHDDIFDALFSLDLTTIKTRQEADTALAKKIPDLALRQFLLKNLERTEADAFQWRIALNEIHQGYSEMIKAFAWNSQSFSQPTLFIRGAHSGYIKDSDKPAIKALFPHARTATIANAGHWVHAEAPQEFTRAVLDFLIEEA
ncbi:MAG: alpha/beta fold hydrolase [Candidatus Binatia bacterium]